MGGWMCALESVGIEMKAVVTGATGFVGGWIVEELLSQGDEVTVVVRNASRVPKHWEDKVRIIESSLEQLKNVQSNDFNEEKADIFFHMAWAGTAGLERTDVGLQLANVEYTCDAVRLAARLGCSRFVNAGSIMEYEAKEYIVQNGSNPGMSYIYSSAKLTADCMAKVVAINEKIEYINAIISNIYGVGEKSARFLNTTIRKMLTNKDIPLTLGDQMYDFIYAEDAAKAIVIAGKKGEKNNSYYIGNEVQRPLKEYIKDMHRILNSGSKLGFGEVEFRGAKLDYSILDVTKMRQLGFVPKISFEEGIIRTRDWIVEVENEY